MPRGRRRGKRYGRRRGRRAEPYALILLAAIISALIFGLLASRGFFATIWQQEAGGSTIKVDTPNPPITIEQLLQVGSYSYPVIVSASPVRGQEGFRAAAMISPSLQISGWSLAIANPLQAPAQLIMPMRVIAEWEYDPGKQYRIELPPYTRTWEKTITSASQGLVTVKTPGTTTARPWTWPTTTTTRPTTTTATPTTWPTTTPQAQMQLEPGAGPWDKVVMEGGRLKATSKPASIKGYQVLKAVVTATHVRGSSSVSVEVVLESDRLGVEARASKIVSPGTSWTITLYSRYMEELDRALRVYLWVPYDVGGKVSASLSFEILDFQDSIAPDVSTARVGPGTYRGYVGDDGYQVVFDSPGDWKICASASNRVSIYLMGFPGGSIPIGGCMPVKVVEVPSTLTIRVVRFDSSSPEPYAISIGRGDVSPPRVAEPTIQKTWSEATSRIGFKAYVFHRIYAESYSEQGSRCGSWSDGYKPGGQQLSITMPNSASIDRSSGAYSVKFCGSLRIIYSQVHLAVPDVPGAPVSMQEVEVVSGGYPNPDTLRVRVPVPVGYTVADSVERRWEWNVRAPYPILGNELEAWGLRNLVASVEERKVKVEVYNNIPSRDSITVEVSVDRRPGLGKTVTVRKFSSAVVEIDVSSWLTDAVIEQYRTKPEFGYKRDFTVYAECRDCPGYRLRSLSGAFYFPRAKTSITVSAEGPGSASVYIGGKMVGGPGRYEALEGDEVAVKAAPLKDAILYGYEVVRADGYVVKKEPIDAWGEHKILMGERVLPSTITFFAEPQPITVKLRFKSLLDPDVPATSAIKPLSTPLRSRISVTGKAEILGFRQYVVDVPVPAGGTLGGRAMQPKAFIDLKLKLTWTVRNDWSFPVDVSYSLKIGRADGFLSPIQVQPLAGSIQVPGGSQRQVEWIVEINQAEVPYEYGTGRSFAIHLSFGGPAKVSTSREQRVSEAGREYIVSQSDEVLFPYTGISRALSWDVRTSTEWRAAAPAGATATAGATAGATPTINIISSSSDGGQSPVEQYASSETSVQYQPVKTKIAYEKDGRRVEQEITALIAPPDADAEGINVPDPVFKPEAGAAAPRKGILERIWDALVGFFKWLAEQISKIFGGGG